MSNIFMHPIMPEHEEPSEEEEGAGEASDGGEVGQCHGHLLHHHHHHHHQRHGGLLHHQSHPHCHKSQMNISRWYIYDYNQYS